MINDSEFFAAELLVEKIADNYDKNRSGKQHMNRALGVKPKINNPPDHNQ